MHALSLAISRPIKIGQKSVSCNFATSRQMDDNSCNGGSDNIDWNIDDEHEIADMLSASTVTADKFF
ncbi:hypothetical protein L2E82_36237 [Cichorium intybus]|uniref:Uncharacterized protein n=1 Tax=Cichorium intybus TaxID=13427 RepID=A0ACB9BR05_CICIN|nr:hypothetical protein L2E82_36237 [Cichorium intybus]